MPYYTYRCHRCYTEDDYWFDIMEVAVALTKPPCSHCNLSDKQDRILAVPLAHSSWHSTGKYGASGYFSPALGKHVSSPAEAQRQLEAKGFVNEADLPKYHAEDKMDAHKHRLVEQQKLEDKYSSLVKSGMTKEDAVVETWTAQDALSGKLDQIYNNKAPTPELKGI